MQPVNFFLSYTKRADNFTGLVEFLPSALHSFWRGGAAAGGPSWSPPLLVTAALCAWSVRLGAFLIHRMTLDGGAIDTRLGEPAERTVALGGFWLVHGCWGFVVSLPVTLVNATAGGGAGGGTGSGVGWACRGGLALWLLGFALEAAADDAKRRSRRRKGSSESYRYYSQEGHALWRLCRHPNFLGETLCWSGLALAASAHLRAAAPPSLGGALAAAAWLSPLLTLGLMLGEAALFAEWRNNRRYSGGALSRPYRAYRASTSLLWPCPPHLYRQLPGVVRVALFFDWPVYRRHLSEE